jgi:hypothetical protein
MPVLTQFSGTLQGGEFHPWRTYGWSRDQFVNWSVRPSVGQVGQVVLRALAVEADEDGTLSYILTVWNLGRSAISFDALFEFEDF